MTKYQHWKLRKEFCAKNDKNWKAICDYCKEQEFDGTWIRKNGTKKFYYICYNCIEPFFNVIQNEVKA